MINFVTGHPWLLALVLPSIMASIPGLLVWAEKAALSSLISHGDPADQEAIRATVKIWVVWAEKKYNIGGQGESKFVAVNTILARALPFIADVQREKLIEEAVNQLDAAANAVLVPPPSTSNPTK